MEKDSSLDRITLALSKLKSELVSYEENKIIENNLIEILHGSNHLIKHFLLIFINFNRFLLEKQHF